MSDETPRRFLRDELAAREERIRNLGARMEGRTPVDPDSPLGQRLLAISKDESRSDEDRAWSLDILAGREEIGWPERNPVRPKIADGGEGTNYDSSVSSVVSSDERFNATLRDAYFAKRSSGRETDNHRASLTPKRSDDV